MGINRIDFNGNTLIDLTTDTIASAADIVNGKVGHLRDGTRVTGTAVIPTDGDNLSYGYVSAGVVGTAKTGRATTGGGV